MPPSSAFPRGQGIYIVGLATVLVYYGHYELWPVFYPMTVELSCVVYLTFLKIYFEKSAARGKNGSVRGAAQLSCVPSESSPLVGLSTSASETSL